MLKVLKSIIDLCQSAQPKDSSTHALLAQKYRSLNMFTGMNGVPFVTFHCRSYSIIPSRALHNKHIKQFLIKQLSFISIVVLAISAARQHPSLSAACVIYLKLAGHWRASQFLGSKVSPLNSAGRKQGEIHLPLKVNLSNAPSFTIMKTVIGDINESIWTHISANMDTMFISFKIYFTA